MSTGANMRGGIAVVGGGPAGLSAALEASRQGLPCVLFEKYRVGERIRCAEGLFDPFVRVPVPRPFIRMNIRKAVLRIGQERFFFRFSRWSRFAIIDRAGWQASLGRQLRSQGVKVVENRAVDPRDLSPEYSLVVDARGYRAFSGRWEELSDPPVFGVQYSLKGDFSRWRNSLEAVIPSDMQAYYWIFPKSRDEANVGFAWLREPKTRVSAKAALEQFLQSEGLADCERGRYAGGFITPTSSFEVFRGNVTRVGDAGGFPSPLHGGGIDAAWLTGALAVKAFVAGDRSVFFTQLNRRMGLIRDLEARVLDKWVADGPAALEKVAGLLQKAGPMVSISSRFLTSGFYASVIRRVYSRRFPQNYYRQA